MLVSHEIEPSFVKEKDLLYVLNEDSRYKTLMLLSIALYLIVLTLFNYFLNKVSKRRTETKKLLFSLVRFESRPKYPVSKLGLAVLFYQIFIMFINMILCNNIKTMKVLVDTKNLITSLDQLLNTKLVVCFFEDHIITSVARMQSPENDTLKRLWDERVYSKPELNPNGKYSKNCLINLSKLRQQFNFTGLALFTDLLYSESVLNKSIKRKPNANYWISKPLFQYLAVSYYRAGLNRMKKNAINN